MPIAVTTVVKDTFWQRIKYKILCMYFKYVFDILVFQMVYDTGRHRVSGGQFLTPHMVRGCPATVAPG